jgi:hypothetical protein
MRGKVLATLLLLVGPVATTQCKRNASRSNSGRVTALKIAALEVAVARGAAALPGVDEAALRGLTIAELARLRHLLYVPGKGQQNDSPKRFASRLRLRVGRTVDQMGDAVGMVSVTAWGDDLLERQGQGTSPGFQAGVAFELDTKDESAGQMKLAVRQALMDIDFQAELALGSKEHLVKALETAKDHQRLLTAIDIVALRRARKAVPRLIALLKHRDQRISDRAIGALVALGDRSAVKPLTRLAKFEDTEKLAKLIDGIGALGGAEAKSYLEFVAGGHPDADIRDLAAEALRRTRRMREGASTPAREPESRSQKL